MYRYMTPKGTFLGGLGTLIDIRSESMSRIVVLVKIAKINI